MSGGSQHNPNGRQAQLGSGWSPLQVANFLSRAPQAHMASERGVTWHTPTPPPPHLYHVPIPSPPDPLQAMKGAASNSVFRHTATPPDLYRHTPTPPDTKHLLRHTPSPGDVKSAATIPPAELYSHLGPSRDKLPRPEELLYGRGVGGGGVDLSLGGRSSNGAPSPALSVRDAPTINSLIARAQPRHPHAKFDAILERLVPSPVSPHSVIVHSRAAPTPSPPSSNEDSADSCGAPPGSKRKRKPDRTIRVPSAPGTPNPPITSMPLTSLPNPSPIPAPEPINVSRVSPSPEPIPVENGETSHEEQNGPEPEKPSEPPEPHSRRKTRSGSAETIDDIAAMIASQKKEDLETSEDIPEKIEGETELDTPVTIDKLKSVLASPEPSKPEAEIKMTPPKIEEIEKQIETPVVEAATAPKRRRSPRNSNSESTNVHVESPSEAKPAEPEASGERTAEPVAASFVEVENQLEKMFAGIEEVPPVNNNNGSNETLVNENLQTNKAKKRRKSVAAKAERKPSRRSSRASTSEELPKKKPGRKKSDQGKIKKVTKEASGKDAYDSGSNASSSRSRGPYVQIRGPGDSPLSVSVINATTGDEETEGIVRRKGEDFRNGLRARGLHASTLGLRYDATTPDATWLCAFCERGPHAHALGDLFGPYTIHTDCEEYRALDEATRHRYEGKPSSSEVWFHEACAVWAPGLVAAGARLWGLVSAVWAARGARCGTCGRPGAGLACAERACKARSHVPCARISHWTLKEEEYRATCPRHA